MELKNLGHQTKHVLSGARKELLERVPNPMGSFQNVNGDIWLTTKEFTSLCPATGGPDFGKINIHYQPNEWIVESKSLKYYLESYRNEPIFHETVVAKICADLGELLEPASLTVSGSFKPRGGISIHPYATWKRA